MCHDLGTDQFLCAACSPVSPGFAKALLHARDSHMAKLLRSEPLPSTGWGARAGRQSEDWQRQQILVEAGSTSWCILFAFLFCFVCIVLFCLVCLVLFGWYCFVWLVLFGLVWLFDFFCCLVARLPACVLACLAWLDLACLACLLAFCIACFTCST